MKGPSSKPEGSLVKDVLQRSLRRSILAASPVTTDKFQAMHTSVPVPAPADEAGRKPLRSILHNAGSSDINMADAVQSEHLHETNSASKKKMTRYATSACHLLPVGFWPNLE